MLHQVHQMLCAFDDAIRVLVEQIEEAALAGHESAEHRVQSRKIRTQPLRVAEAVSTTPSAARRHRQCK
jgi:hypothetical protein